MVTTDFLGALDAGSGLNSKNLVEALVSAERAPRESRLNTKIADSEAEISAFGLIKSSLQTLESAFDSLNDKADFENFTVRATGGLSSSNEAAFSISVDDAASAGTHDIAISSLATADRFISAGFDSTSSSINGGTPFVLNVTVGGTTTNSISVSTATPQGIVDAVNTADIGVTASVIDTGATTSRYKIVFTGTEGAANAFTFTAGGVGETSSIVGTGDISTNNDTLTIASHGFVTGDILTYDSAGGTAIAGLSDATAYHVIRVDDNTIKLASSGSNASSGTQIDLTGTGNDAQIFVGTRSASSSTVTTSNVSTTASTLTISGHGFVTGDRLTYDASSGTALAGLTDGTTYFAIRVDDNTVKLATTAANAAAGTNITLTGTGNDSQTFSGPQPPTVATSSVSTANNRITMTGHGYVTGDVVTYRANGGTAIAGLTDATAYHVIRISADSFKLAATGADALAGTSLAISGTGNSAQFFTGSGIAFNPRSVSASDAALTVNGIDITRSTNSISDIITGMTINLLNTTNSVGTVSITTDSSQVETKLRTLVTAFNSAITTFDTLSDPDATGENAGILSGDSSLRSIENKIKDLFIQTSSTPGTSLSYLSDMGIEMTRSGVLEINETALASALTSNYADIRKMISADTDNQTTIGTASRGVAGDALVILDEFLSSTGVLESRITNNETRIADYKEDLSELDTRMQAIYERYLRQFTAMEKAIDEMNSMRDYLKQQIEALPFNNRDK